MIIKLAWRNIWRNKRRSYLTIGSIMFAVILAVFMRSMQMGSYENMIENSVRFYTGHIQIHKNGYWDDKIIDNSMAVDSNLLTSIPQFEGVTDVVPRVESFILSAYGTKTRGSMIMGIDPIAEDGLTRLKSKLIEGDYLDINDKAVLISEGLAQYLGMSIGDTLVMLGQGYHGASAAAIYPVKGIVRFPVKAQNDQSVFLPISQAQWLYDATDLLTSISIMVDKPSNVERIKKTIKSQVDESELEVMDWQELTPEMIQAIEIDDLSSKFMLYILYLVIGFGMLGTFMMMTAERQYEFGVMISIGMSRLKMQVTIALEMLMMTFMALFIGIGVTLPGLLYLHLNPIELTGDVALAAAQKGVEAMVKFSLEPEIFLNQAWAIFFMSFILGFYPLRSIQKLKPVKAMRGE
ncbi:MAG: ABC transporter permease [Salibacteraceae bacterium]